MPVVTHPYRAKSPNLPMHLHFQDRGTAHRFAQAQSVSLDGQHTVEWLNLTDRTEWALTAVYEGGLLVWAQAMDVPISELGS